VSPEEKAKQMESDLKAADKARKDAEATAGEKLDNILKCLDALGTRMDAYDDARRKDAEKEKEEETAKGKEKKPVEEAGEFEKLDGDRLLDPTPAEEVFGKPRPLAADSRADSIRADAEEIDFFRKEIGTTYKVQADSVLAHIQADADKAASAWGKSAVHPWDGERITAYRRRTAREHQQHSPSWKNVDLSMISGQTLRNATAQIFADSIAASTSPATYGETLREVRHRDPDTGHLVKTYYGEPRAWMQQFAGGPPRLARFRFAKNDSA
jgi:hypothetical protein